MRATAGSRTSAEPAWVRDLARSLARRPRLGLVAAVVVPVLIFYAPLLLGARSFPDGDFTHHFFPFNLFQADALRSLRLALWNPFTYGGHPFLADTQAAAYYPISNLLLLLTLPLQGEVSRLYLLQVEAVLHTGLAGLFGALLVRGLGAQRWAAALAGATFALSGYLTAYPPLQLAVLRSAIWLPLALWLLWRAAGGRQVGWSSVGAGLALACSFLAGHPQTFLYVAYATAAWALLLVILAARDGGPGAGLRFGLWALGITLPVALLVSAAQLLPSLEFTGLSVRAAVDYAYVSGGFPLQDGWQILLPGVFSYYSPLHVGAAALGLAGISLAAARFLGRGRSRRGAAVLFFLGLGVAALGLSFGGNAPVYPLVWRFLPGWDLFRGQERAAYLVALSLSVLAGLGAGAAAEMPFRTRRRAGLVYAALVIALVYAFGLLWQLPGRTAIGNARYLVLAVVTLGVASALALLLWLPGWSLRRSAVLVGLALLPLYFFGMGLNFEAVGLRQRVAVTPEVQALSAAVQEQGAGAVGLPGRVYNEYRAYEDYSMRAQVEDLWGSSPLRLARYARFADGFPLDRWWALTGVEHVLTWRRDLFVPATLLAEYPQATDTTYLHRLDAPTPRAWLATTVQLADDDEAFALLADHNFDLRSTLLLPPESGAAASALPAVEGNVHLEAVTPERLRVEVEASGDALLYVSQVWMPGWRVQGAPPLEGTIAGLAPFRVQRAHLSFVAVPVPPGSHAFDLVYRPASVQRGQLLSAIALILLGAAAVVTLARGRSRRP